MKCCLNRKLTKMERGENEALFEVLLKWKHSNLVLRLRR